MQHYSSINAALWNSLKNRQKFNFFRRACLSTIGHEGHSVCVSSVFCHTPNVRTTRILNKYPQYSLKILTKFWQNLSYFFKMSSMSNPIHVIQKDFGQLSFWSSLFGQNFETQILLIKIFLKNSFWFKDFYDRSSDTIEIRIRLR